MTYLSKHMTAEGPRWGVDGYALPHSFTLGMFLQLPQSAQQAFLHAMPRDEQIEGPLMAPIDDNQEVWASGVTYLRSRDAREAESATGDIYMKVYDAERPELFLKAVGWRVIGPGGNVRIRPDSTWSVPEPELTLVINKHMEIIGICAGNDMSSRNIEGENPLYLPQAKVYNGSCALGPRIEIPTWRWRHGFPITLTIVREGETVFEGETNTDQMKRTLEDLVAYLGKELDFPNGVFLMTGTGLVPPDDFTLHVGDVVTITIGHLTLTNTVTS